jgi:putative transcriptional regulator
LKDSDLTRYEADRDLAADLLQAVREMKAGKLHVVLSSVAEVQEKIGLSQTQFATLVGVSVRTPEGWEQGRK